MTQIADVKLVDKDGYTYGSNVLVKLDIQQSVPDSASIGNTASARLSCSIITDKKFLKKSKLVVYRKSGEEWHFFGRFYVDGCVRDGPCVSITAYDAMNFQGNQRVKFTGASSKNLAALDFPCSIQNMLDYVCSFRNFTCNFKCENFIVEKKPVYDEENEDYYSVREIIGFIASAHASNAMFSLETGELLFKSFQSNSSVQITASNTLDQKLNDSEPFTVTGIIFRTDYADIRIDDSGTHENAEEAEEEISNGLVECDNPFATIAVAEYVWHLLGGMTYYGGKIVRRISADVQCGDIISMPNMKYPIDTEIYPVCITNVSYSISEDGFNETLSGTTSGNNNSTVHHESKSLSSYNAGEGIEIKNSTVNLLPAGRKGGGIGGVYTGATTGLTIDWDGYMHLNYGTSAQFGGMLCGDGLEAYRYETWDKFSPGYKTRVRLGRGLEYAVPPEGEDDPSDVWEANGRAIQTKIGLGLKINENGEIVPDLANMYGYLGAILIWNGVITLRYNTADFKIGNDGLELVNKGYKAGSGIVVSKDNTISVNYGSGLYIDENGLLAASGSNPKMTTGNGISIERFTEDDSYFFEVMFDRGLTATQEGIIEVNCGEGLKFDSSGRLTVENNTILEAGEGIEIIKGETDNTVSAKVDGETIVINSNGELEAVDRGYRIVLDEKDSSNLLYEYEVVEYQDGYKLAYGSSKNSIIIQGIVAESVASAEEAAAIGAKTSSVQIKSFSGATETEYNISLAFFSESGRLTTLRIMNGDSILGSIQTPSRETAGFLLAFTSISGAVSEKAPFGYAQLDVYVAYKDTTGALRAELVSSPSRKNYAFKSETEYHSAIGLTYTPNIKKKVIETVTEV